MKYKSEKVGALESKEESKLTGYWKRFKFRGNPPPTDSVAEKRLIEYCTDYTEFLLKEGLRGVTGSDERRRELHNNIAVMVTGRLRSDMSHEEAWEISNFASYVALGQSIDEALREVA